MLNTSQVNSLKISGFATHSMTSWNDLPVELKSLVCKYFVHDSTDEFLLSMYSALDDYFERRVPYNFRNMVDVNPPGRRRLLIHLQNFVISFPELQSELLRWIRIGQHFSCTGFRETASAWQKLAQCARMSTFGLNQQRQGLAWAELQNAMNSAVTLLSHPADILAESRQQQLNARILDTAVVRSPSSSTARTSPVSIQSLSWRRRCAHRFRKCVRSCFKS